MNEQFSKMLSKKAPTVKQFVDKRSVMGQDVCAREGIQIEIRQDGETIWINVDGICALRVFNPDEKKIEIIDNRK